MRLLLHLVNIFHLVWTALPGCLDRELDHGTPDQLFTRGRGVHAFNVLVKLDGICMGDDARAQ